MNRRTTIPRPVDRPSAQQWAQAILSAGDVVFLDTETTGLGRGAEIVDIAIVAVDGTVLVDQLVRPAGRIPIDAVLIHGISDDHVRDAPAWCDVLQMVEPHVSGRTVVAYNSSFDRAMIEQCCAAASLRSPEISWECAMRAFAAYRVNRALPSRGYRWRPLYEAAEWFKLSIPSHRALADATACLGVVKGMASFRSE